jgi:hypothetical protein
MDRRCELCDRPVEGLTRHHLIPRSRHRAERRRGRFARAELTGRLASLCRPCHSHIHGCFSEKELAERLNTVVALRAEAEVARFCDWIRDKPATIRVPQRRPRHRSTGHKPRSK